MIHSQSERITQRKPRLTLMTDEPLEIHLIADSTGESAARIARAAVAQFPSQDFKLIRHRRVNTTTALIAALDAVRNRTDHKTAVFFTLCNEELASLVKATCQDMDVPYADLMTDAMRAIQRISGVRPDQVPLRPVGVEADYFERIAAIDFAVRNDDGAFPDSFIECDICLVGPSRSGKTPLSIFLGYLGYRAVNVPIVPGIEPPEQLWDVDKWRIVGLTMDAEKLQQIRSERVRGLGARGMKDGYSSLLQICDELDAVEKIHRKLGCPVINTTDVALEESAARVIDLVDERAGRLGHQLRRPPNLSSDLPRH